MSEEPYEPLSPLDIERRLRWLSNQLTLAQQDLATARDTEVDRKHDLNRERRRWLLSDGRPKVTRDGFTAAERDAWVEDKIEEQQRAYDVAVAARESAQDHLRVLRDQAEIVRSLGVSVRQAYELAGVGS